MDNRTGALGQHSFGKSAVTHSRYLHQISLNESRYSFGMASVKSILMSALVLLLVILPIRGAQQATGFLYACILIVELLLMLVSLSAKEKITGLTCVHVPIVVLVVYLTLRAMSDSFGSAERVIQTLVYALTLETFGHFQWNTSRLVTLRRLFVLLMCISTLLWATTGFINSYYASFYTHSNAFGVVLLVSAAIILMSSKSLFQINTVLELSLCILLMIVANSRSAIASLIMMLIGTLILRMRGKTNRVNITPRVIFIGVLVACLVFSIVYPALLDTNLGYSLELLSRKYFNKNFFSGREIIWKMVLTAIQGHEILGLGLAMIPASIYNTEYSSHNLYLQTLLQSGAIGLALLVWILYRAAMQCARSSSRVSNIGFGVIICVLVHEALEVSLTQNNFAVGLLFWAVIGIALSEANMSKVCERGEA